MARTEQGSSSTRRALAGFRRCDAPALWYSLSNGYRACTAHSGRDGVLLDGHTAGPWRPAMAGQNLWIMADDVYLGFIGGSIVEGESIMARKANAQLMALAPDLLTDLRESRAEVARLREVVSYGLGVMEDGATLPKMQIWVDAAHAAMNETGK